MSLPYALHRYAWIVLPILLSIAFYAFTHQPHEAATRAEPVPTQTASAPAPARSAAAPSFLPPEAEATLARIARGGPHPHRQDGQTFQNRERRLPAQPSGYYREYTVDTPGSRDRGARRIVSGGDPPREYWYTDDHYGTFRRFEGAR